MSDRITDPKQRQIVRMILSGQWDTVFGGDDTQDIIDSMRFRLIGKLVLPVIDFAPDLRVDVLAMTGSSDKESKPPPRTMGGPH